MLSGAFVCFDGMLGKCVAGGSVVVVVLQLSSYRLHVELSRIQFERIDNGDECAY